MGAVVSCFTGALRAVGGCLMAVVNAIGGILHSIVGGIVAVLDAIISCVTCGSMSRHGSAGTTRTKPRFGRRRRPMTTV